MAGTILFVSTKPVNDVEANAVAHHLKDRHGLSSIVVDATFSVKDLDAGVAAGVVASDRRSSDAERASSKLSRLRRLLLSNESTRVALLLRGILRDRARAGRLLSAHDVRAVVIFDDRRIRPDRVALHLASASGIPTILLPFAASSVESDLFIRRNRAELILGERPWRRLKQSIAAHWPDQIATAPDGRRMTFFTPLETLLLRKVGLLPGCPWIWGGGGADRICATDEGHREYVLMSGIDPARIAVTGQPSLDGLALSPTTHFERQQRIFARYGLRAGIPLVVCAVPQYGEHGLVDWDTHWKLTDELFETLGRSGGNVVLSLHPKSKKEAYIERAERHRLVILDERLVEVLPVADLLVGTFSSTIAWSIGLGIPAMIVDSLASGFALFRDIKGVRVVETQEPLDRELQQFTREPAVREAWRNDALLGSARVGRIDGRNAERAAAVIAEAAEQRHTAPLHPQAVRPKRSEPKQETGAG